jgi:hypothetical protein
LKDQIRNIPLLKKVLWADSILGGVTAAAGLCWYTTLATFLGLQVNIIVIIASITMAYALLALSLAIQGKPSILPLKILIYANGVWSTISIALLIIYFSDATIFGAAFLILQVAVVAMLAWLEGSHIRTRFYS